MTFAATPSEISPKKLIQLYRNWLRTPETREPYSENTILAYEQTLRRFERFIEENDINDIKEVNLFVIRTFLRGYAEKLSSQSIFAMRSALSSFFDYLHYEDIVDENPVSQLVAKQKKAGRGGRKKVRLPPVLSESEIESLMMMLDMDNSRYGLKRRAMVGLLLDTGMRVSEMLSLAVSDANCLLEGHAVTIIGKGNKERRIPYLGHYAETLSAYLEIISLPENAPLFPDRINKERPMGRSSVYLAINKALRQAGIAKPQKGPHLLRHTAASIMLKEGNTTVEVRDALGHSSTAITETYLHAI
ncbi:hypothetical protein D6779_00785 [Candidatus Parcubacteria bacterium]|nr:MAG: hypothetical protein D6779_00785 [Candidatus Parcubacteria bacterium]